MITPTAVGVAVSAEWGSYVLVEKPSSAVAVKSARFYGKPGKATVALSPLPEPGGPVSPKISPAVPRLS